AAVLAEACGQWQPSDVTVANNTVRLFSERQIGVAITGVVRSSVESNSISWDTSAASGDLPPGIYVRPTAPMKVVSIVANVIGARGFGIRVDSGPATIDDSLSIDRNSISYARGSRPAKIGINVTTVGPPTGAGALRASAIYRKNS